MRCFVAGMILLSIASTALALSPGTDVLVPAAARGPGSAGSLWVTSLGIGNPGDQAVSATVQWLERGQANPTPQEVPLTLAPGETLSFDQALDELFGLDAGGGALRIVSDRPVIVSASILNRAGGSEFGQGFEGIPVTSALLPGHGSQILGVTHGESHRSNIYLVDASGEGSTATLTVNPGGADEASKDYVLSAHMPVLEPVTALGVDSITAGTVAITVHSGAVIAGVSRINGASGDPLTLEASTPAGAPGLAECAPSSITGMRVRLIHPVPGGENEVFEITATSETTGTVSDGFTSLDATFTYRSFGTGALILAEVPELGMTDIRTTFLCASHTTAAMVGSGETTFGTLTITGSVEILERAH